MNFKQILKEAVALLTEKRALLVDSLLRSLDQPESAIDKKWVSVANGRLSEMRSGKVEPVPGDEVFERILKKIVK